MHNRFGTHNFLRVESARGKERLTPGPWVLGWNDFVGFFFEGSDIDDENFLQDSYLCDERYSIPVVSLLVAQISSLLIPYCIICMLIGIYNVR